MSQDDQVFKYGRIVLKRTVAAVTALASYGLHLQGTTKTFVPPTNNRRIRILPCRANIYVQKPKKGHRFYLSSCACGQSMKLMLHRVLKELLNLLETANIFQYIPVQYLVCLT